MRKTIEEILGKLAAEGNLRRIPTEHAGKVVDLSSNDYLGLSERRSLREEFLDTVDLASIEMSASASRLLASRQRQFDSLENTLEEAYGLGLKALLFNSGYHANTGLVGALGSLPGTYILSDKLVHASIIDGIKLSGAPFGRFRHNDYAHLRRLAEKASAEYDNILLIVESVYSMDGDRADMDTLRNIKRDFPKIFLYVDEAHAVGATGERGLGLSRGTADIIVGTFGKALASVGAYAMLDETMRSFMVNKARSFIFSTALPPINIAWTEFIFRKALSMDEERQTLAKLGQQLGEILSRHGFTGEASHIMPLLTGDPRRAVDLSQKLRNEGFEVLPIRTPTVPPGTDRLRFSLSASVNPSDIERLGTVLDKILD